MNLTIKEQIKELKKWELGLFKCLKFCKHTKEEQEEIKTYLKLIREEIDKLQN